MVSVILFSLSYYPLFNLRPVPIYEGEVWTFHKGLFMLASENFVPTYAVCCESSMACPYQV